MLVISVAGPKYASQARDVATQMTLQDFTMRTDFMFTTWTYILKTFFTSDRYCIQTKRSVLEALPGHLQADANVRRITELAIQPVDRPLLSFSSGLPLVLFWKVLVISMDTSAGWVCHSF